MGNQTNAQVLRFFKTKDWLSKYYSSYFNYSNYDSISTEIYLDKLFTSLNRAIEINGYEHWIPKITKTVAISGQGIDELYDNMMNHKVFLNSNVTGRQKLDERYIKTVKSFISQSLIEKFWSDKIDETLKKELSLEYQKRLSPYQIACKLLK